MVRVIIEVQKGQVQYVYSNKKDEFINISVLDLDVLNITDDHFEKRRLKKLNGEKTSLFNNDFE
jgi:hypothetical protein